jgi:hypothetical protein
VPAPLAVRGALAEAHAWRLVTVRGRIEDTRRLGDRTRAEVVVGKARLVVVAQPAVGISADALPEGATVEITGIVRLAYPNATDRRPSLLPRSSADVRVVAAAPASGSTTAAGAAGSGAASAATGSVAALDWVDADLVDLATVVGQTVRVGGLVVGLQADGFSLDDGTAVGAVVLAGSAAELLPLIEPGDAINVIGRVEDRDGEPVVVVDDAGAVALGADLGAGVVDPTAASSPSPTASEGATAGLRTAGFSDPTAGLPGFGAGLASVLLVAVVSVLVTWLRRRDARVRWQARVTARLAAIAGPDPTIGGPTGTNGPANVG